MSLFSSKEFNLSEANYFQLNYRYLQFFIMKNQSLKINKQSTKNRINFKNQSI